MSHQSHHSPLEFGHIKSSYTQSSKDKGSIGATRGEISSKSTKKNIEHINNSLIAFEHADSTKDRQKYASDVKMRINRELIKYAKNKDDNIEKTFESIVAHKNPTDPKNNTYLEYRPSEMCTVATTSYDDSKFAAKSERVFGELKKYAENQSPTAGSMCLYQSSSQDEPFSMCCVSKSPDIPMLSTISNYNNNTLNQMSKATVIGLGGPSEVAALERMSIATSELEKEITGASGYLAVKNNPTNYFVFAVMRFDKPKKIAAAESEIEREIKEDLLANDIKNRTDEINYPYPDSDAEAETAYSSRSVSPTSFIEAPKPTSFVAESPSPTSFVNTPKFTSLDKEQLKKIFEEDSLSRHAASISRKQARGSHISTEAYYDDAILDAFNENYRSKAKDESKKNKPELLNRSISDIDKDSKETKSMSDLNTAGKESTLDRGASMSTKSLATTDKKPGLFSKIRSSLTRSKDKIYKQKQSEAPKLSEQPEGQGARRKTTAVKPSVTEDEQSDYTEISDVIPSVAERPLPDVPTSVLNCAVLKDRAAMLTEEMKKYLTYNGSITTRATGSKLISVTIPVQEHYLNEAMRTAASIASKVDLQLDPETNVVNEITITRGDSKRRISRRRNNSSTTTEAQTDTADIDDSDNVFAKPSDDSKVIAPTPTATVTLPVPSAPVAPNFSGGIPPAPVLKPGLNKVHAPIVVGNKKVSTPASTGRLDPKELAAQLQKASQQRLTPEQIEERLKAAKELTKAAKKKTS